MKNRILICIGGALFALMILFNLNLSNVKSEYSISTNLASLAKLAVVNAECIADDPGECSASCTNGTICCVGLSPNCEEDPLQNNWIDCGSGKMYC